MRMLARLAVFTIIGLAAPAQAEVQKFMNMCGGDAQSLRLCPSYALVMTLPDGWIEDKAATREHKVQVVVPKGETYASAPALIYVKVSLRNKEQPLADFIRVSEERWKESVPDSVVTRLPEVERANARAAFAPYRYDNPSTPQQAAEIVSFGIDSDRDGNEFVLMVVVTAREKKALDRADGAYKAFLRAN